MLYPVSLTQRRVIHRIALHEVVFSTVYGNFIYCVYLVY